MRLKGPILDALHSVSIQVDQPPTTQGAKRPDAKSIATAVAKSLKKTRENCCKLQAILFILRVGSIPLED